MGRGGERGEGRQRRGGGILVGRVAGGVSGQKQREATIKTIPNLKKYKKQKNKKKKKAPTKEPSRARKKRSGGKKKKR